MSVPVLPSQGTSGQFPRNKGSVTEDKEISAGDRGKRHVVIDSMRCNDHNRQQNTWIQGVEKTVRSTEHSSNPSGVIENPKNLEKRSGASVLLDVEFRPPPVTPLSIVLRSK